MGIGQPHGRPFGRLLGIIGEHGGHRMTIGGQQENHWGPLEEHWGQFDEPLDPEEQSDTIVEAREPEVSRA